MGFQGFVRFLTFGLLMAATGLATAQSYPDKSKTIRLIVPFSAGSSADVFARAIVRGMADAGLNAIVDNRPGGESIVGINAVMAAPPDGYTIMLTSLTTQVVNPHVLPNLPYHPLNDFVPLTAVAKTALYFNVGPGSPFKTVREFVAAAKASPGKYTFATGTTTMQMAVEMLKLAAGVDVLIVPHKNATDAAIAVAGNQLDAIIVDAAVALPVIQRGGRALATSAGTRTSRFPAIPTMKEEGVTDYDLVGWFGTYAPARTPPAVAERIREILRASLKTRYVQDVLETFAMEPLEVDLDAFQRADYERWGKAVRASRVAAKK